jgi:hypothetical protein
MKKCPMPKIAWLAHEAFREHPDDQQVVPTRLQCGRDALLRVRADRNKGSWGLHEPAVPKIETPTRQNKTHPPAAASQSVATGGGTVLASLIACVSHPAACAVWGGVQFSSTTGPRSLLPGDGTSVALILPRQSTARANDLCFAGPQTRRSPHTPRGLNPP